MDIISHAVAGAATGAVFGHPLTGAVVAVLPDLPIFGKRKATPPTLYKFSHSLLAVVLVGLIGSTVGLAVGLAAGFAYLSHILLDSITHSETWAPKWLWPSVVNVNPPSDEWEFFNAPWWRGFEITLVYSVLCLLVAYA